MKKILGVAVVICALGLLSVSPALAGGTFRIGGGIYFDETLPGGHISIDIAVGEGKFAISPFADMFFKDILKIYAGGINVLIKRDAGESAKVYFGAGGGMAQVKTNFPTLGSISSTGAMADAVVGLEFPVGEKASIFGQGKWIGTFGDIEVRNFAAEVGIAFNFGE